MDICISKNKINGIPYLEISKPTDIKKALIILYHGYTGYKETFLEQAYFLADNGYHVVLPDAFNHGERKAKEQVYDFFESIFKTTKEINILIDHFKSISDINVNKIGLAGMSMGGCIVHNYLVSDEINVNSAVCMISSPDWVSIIKTEAAYKSFVSSGMINHFDSTDKILELAHKLQPISKIDKYGKVPLLMLNGKEDQIMPVDNVVDFYNKVKNNYKDETNISIKIYDVVSHYRVNDMNKKTIEWFNKTL